MDRRVYTHLVYPFKRGDEKDSVYFILNDTAVSRFKKVFFITDDRYYSDKIKSYSKKELVDLYRKDSIYTIDRD